MRDPAVQMFGDSLQVEGTSSRRPGLVRESSEPVRGWPGGHCKNRVVI